jgi:hypothetical protein
VVVSAEKKFGGNSVSHDLKINYCGTEIVLEPLSPKGREWLSAALGCENPDAGAWLRLRDLDVALSAARQAGMRLGVPWD